MKFVCVTASQSSQTTAPPWQMFAFRARDRRSSATGRTRTGTTTRSWSSPTPRAAARVPGMPLLSGRFASISSFASLQEAEPSKVASRGFPNDS